MHSNCLLKTALKHRSLPPFTTKRENEAFGHSKESSPNDSPSQPAVKKAAVAAAPPVERFCLCAPTNHPGSFRCRYHRSRQRQWAGRPLNSAIKSIPRPSSSEGVYLSSETGAVLPPKLRSSGCAHETTRPSRLRRMEVAASVSSNSETSVSRCSTPGSCDFDAVVSQLEQIKDNEVTRNASDVVQVTSNTAVLEDDYKCALRVIQISQAASEFGTDKPIEVATL